MDEAYSPKKYDKRYQKKPTKKPKGRPPRIPPKINTEFLDMPAKQPSNFRGSSPLRDRLKSKESDEKPESERKFSYEK